MLSTRWIFLLVLCTNSLSAQAKTFFVSDYGTHAQAAQLAINAAIADGPNNIVTFGYGVYNITSAIGISNGTNLTITGQGMDQTLLLGVSPRMYMFLAQYCNGLIITKLSIDFDPLPFTAGFVVASTSTYVDVQIASPHQTNIGQRVEGLIRYDTNAMRPAFGAYTYNYYQVPPASANTSLVSPGVLRIPVASQTKFTAGDGIVAVYDIGYQALYAHDLKDLTVQSINIRAAWGMAFVTHRVRRLTVLDYHVTAVEGRWFSANSDCMHFVSTREFISLSNSKCQSQGDDGINVLTHYVTVAKVVNASALILSGFNGTDPLIIEDGTDLEFSSSKQPFTQYSRGTIASSFPLSASTERLFVFTSPVNASVGDFACISDVPSLTIRNFTVEHNRARGMLLETRNVDVRNCVFNRTSGPAVLMQSSLYWHEGVPGQNVTLADNLYINCNEGVGQQQGVITILPDPVQLVPVNDEIRIESSTFYFGNFSRGLIHSNNANNLYLTGNYIATNSSQP